jgi:hypothetical protein
MDRRATAGPAALAVATTNPAWFAASANTINSLTAVTIYFLKRFER